MSAIILMLRTQGKELNGWKGGDGETGRQKKVVRKSLLLRLGTKQGYNDESCRWALLINPRGRCLPDDNNKNNERSSTQMQRQPPPKYTQTHTLTDTQTNTYL